MTIWFTRDSPNYWLKGLQRAEKPSADVLGRELFVYLITLSARYSTDCGIVTPICS